MSLKTSCRKSGPTPVIEPESPEQALHREMRELVKIAKELGSKQLVSEYKQEKKHLCEVLQSYPTFLEVERHKLIGKLASSLVQELRAKAAPTEPAWQQMTARENCNRVIVAARRWLPDEVLYS